MHRSELYSFFQAGRPLPLWLVRVLGQLNLFDYMIVDAPPQKKQLTRYFRCLSERLETEFSPSRWFEISSAGHEENIQRICEGKKGAEELSRIQFIFDVVGVTAAGVDSTVSYNPIGSIKQLGLTQKEWDEIMRDYHRTMGSPFEKSSPPCYSEFAGLLIRSALRENAHGFLRNLYFFLYEKTDSLAQTAMSRAKNLDEWIFDLRRLAVHLFELKQLPVRQLSEHDDQSRPAGSAYEPGSAFVEAPFLLEIMNDTELELLRKQRNVSEEYFAHLGTAASGGFVSKRTQSLQYDEYKRRLEINRLDAREWLINGKCRFQIAPFIGAQ